MNYFKKMVESLLLLLWRILPIPRWLKGLALYLINYKYIVGVLAIITDENGKILLFRHTYIKKSPWGLPGGAAKHEDLRDALKRELKEESGMLIEVNSLIGVAQYDGRYINFLFSCSILKGNFKSSVEVDTCGYFLLDELPEVVPAHRIIIDNLARQTNTWPRLETDYTGYWIKINETIPH